jgi:hypothetical protein
MKEDRFRAVCESLKEGQESFIENRHLLYKGKVLECGEDEFVVEVFGHRATWPRNECEETRFVNPLGPRSDI